MKKTFDMNRPHFFNMTLQEALQMIINTGGDQLEAVVRVDADSEFKIILKVEEVGNDR